MNPQTDKTVSFMDAARPLVPDLLASAKHHIRYHQAIGDRIDELSPEELVGETLIRASDRGTSRPDGVPLRSWMLALEMRTLDDLVAHSAEERKLWSFSLDQPIPPPTATDFDDSFWDWYQPPEEAPSMAQEVADPTANPDEAQTALEDDTG
jgi:DNA-directed RNA polymerase specialized sigma24 family protein